jgi:hypothetical protein
VNQFHRGSKFLNEYPEGDGKDLRSLSTAGRKPQWDGEGPRRGLSCSVRSVRRTGRFAFRSSQRDLCPGKVILGDAPIEAAKKWGNAGPGKVGVLNRHFAIPLRPIERSFLGQPVIHDTLPHSKISPE